jgi:hypothetical protein
MTDIVTRRHPRRITRPADVEQVVVIADLYASQACHLHEIAEGEELHKALSGAFLMFLTDVAQSES